MRVVVVVVGGDQFEICWHVSILFRLPLTISFGVGSPSVSLTQPSCDFGSTNSLRGGILEEFFPNSCHSVAPSAQKNCLFRRRSLNKVCSCFSRIVVVDAQTFLIPSFSYDGQVNHGEKTHIVRSINLQIKLF